MSTRPDDLAPLFNRKGDPDWSFHQAKVVEWDPETGEGLVRMLGENLPDMPILSGLEGFSLAPGDVVAVGQFKSQPFILGRVVTANDPARKDLQFIIYSQAGLIVKGGGSVTVEDGGAIRAEYADGSAAILYGSLTADADGTQSGHGLLVQRSDQGDIFRAKQETGGNAKVVIGQSSGFGTNRVDEFDAYADSIFFDATGSAVLFGNQEAYIQTGASTFVGVEGNDAFFNAGGLAIIHALDQVQLDSGAGQYFFTTNPITGSGTPLVFDTDTKGIYRDASSRRYKRDIADADLDPAVVLQARPRSFRLNSEVERDADAPAHVGFIAEELADIGLEDAVRLDEKGRPDSVVDRALIAGLVTLAQRQAAQIEDLAARVAALEGPP